MTPGIPGVSIPIPTWGWTLDLNDQVWRPVWSNLPMASKATGITQIFAIVNVTDNVIIRESSAYSAHFNVSDC